MKNMEDFFDSPFVVIGGIIIGIAIFIGICCGIKVSTMRHRGWHKTEIGWTKTAEIDGHEYIMYRSTIINGTQAGMEHSPSCPCHSNE